MDFLYILLASLAGGVLAGMGMGGGTLTLPLLVLCLGVGQLTAQFANLLAFLPSGALSLCLHIKNGLVRKDNLLIFLLPALATCVGCSFVALQTSGELLKKLFGGFLVVIALSSFFAKTLKKY